ncbi:uncharacterized protein LOC126416916 [Schistocerca serialis cubense]|uniref:uncharacterized protein LOC126416916 n=1 Tax=Schistocerca serialis cubense TaxID=2023355 RepID=UPI00214E796F|nr:uncharacterized protein LOC126416916 [Schistocerca serialis cubense]
MAPFSPPPGRPRPLCVPVRTCACGRLEARPPACVAPTLHHNGRAVRRMETQRRPASGSAEGAPRPGSQPHVAATPRPSAAVSFREAANCGPRAIAGRNITIRHRRLPKASTNLFEGGAERILAAFLPCAALPANKQAAGGYVSGTPTAGAPQQKAAAATTGESPAAKSARRQTRCAPAPRRRRDADVDLNTASKKRRSRRGRGVHTAAANGAALKRASAHADERATLSGPCPSALEGVSSSVCRLAASHPSSPDKPPMPPCCEDLAKPRQRSQEAESQGGQTPLPTP